ncbi:MAG: hypothetical protein JOZ42_01315 [Acetobacteraceae bacterium]|nr:hypothetical protein [Acetobacteraceae bacterium]
MFVTSLSLIYTHGQLLLVIPELSSGPYPLPHPPPRIVVVAVVLFGGYFLGDYIAIAKTRWLLSRVHLYKGGLSLLGLYLSDVILSLFIGSGVWVLPFIILSAAAGVDFPGPDHTGSDPVIVRAFYDTSIPPPLIAIETALLSSVWTALIFLAALALKVIPPLQVFLGWYFDVSKHPLRAIGMVAWAIVILCGVLWSLIIRFA